MIGVVLLVHDQPRRTGQLARHMAREGCKVAVHIDARASEPEVAYLTRILKDQENIVFTPRRHCEWGMFSLVAASLDSLEALFARWPDITHVCQLSGACLPIKPIPMLTAHLAANRGVDFIESVPVELDPWVIDGLSIERFTLYHPFPWRKRKWLFDRNVDLQRLLRLRRRIPDGLQPRIGSQWWCLSAETLRAILGDPRLPEYIRYFEKTWIPDESFFQTLAARHSDRITSQPLTFVRFDPQGKPYVFYDDHRDLLLTSDAFFARKIWRGANRLYETFLSPDLAQELPDRPGGETLLKRYEKARRLHKFGRRGLLCQGRHFGGSGEKAVETAGAYLVLDGLDRLLPTLCEEFAAQPGAIVHGHVFAPDRVEFQGGAPVFTGNLSADPKIRDYHPQQFLSKLIWAERDSTQVILHDFSRPSVMTRAFVRDPNATIVRLTDAWLLDLHDVWRTEPARLDAALADALQTGRELASRVESIGPRARLVELGIGDVLRGGVALNERFAEHLPPPLCEVPVLSSPDLPRDFGAFLSALAALPSCPPGVADIAVEVERYQTMARALRRKT